MLDIMQNLDEYSATREQELEQKKADDAKAAATMSSLITETPGVDVPGVSNNNADQSSRVEGKLIDNTAASEGAMKAVAAGSSPTATQSRGITMDSFTIGPNGMPIAKPKSTSAAAPEKKSEKSEEEQANEREAAKFKRQADTNKEAEKGKDGGKKETPDKAATLDDVVKSINALNTKMGQLIAVNEDGHKASAKAAKSGSNNLYARS
jgi:hypothetical protein